MKTRLTHVLAAALVAVAAVAAAPAAEEPKFDFRVQIDMTPELVAQLKPGDLLQVILRPEVQFDRRSVRGEPLVLQRTYQPGMASSEVLFPKALAPDQIYRLEMRVTRGDQKVRYVSALAKLPRRPVDNGIRVRLFQGEPGGQRENHVMVVKDQDGVYRVQMFFA